MKQTGNAHKRPRSRMHGGRPNHNRSQNNINRVYESQSPDGKLRGNAQQLVEKYLGLARDASASGDRVKSESFYQHADHYQRIVLSFKPEPRPEPMAPSEPVEGVKETSAPEAEGSAEKKAAPSTEKEGAEEATQETLDEKPAPRRKPRARAVKKEETTTDKAEPVESA